jgi:hypothetical protein
MQHKERLVVENCMELHTIVERRQLLLLFQATQNYLSEFYDLKQAIHLINYPKYTL